MKQGFTLPDTLIGITVFLIAASSLFGLLNTVIGLSSKAQRSFEAMNIAREGVEIIEQVRNTNLIHHLLWNTKETDDFWGTNQLFASLNEDHPLCMSISPTQEEGKTPWDMKEIPGGCAYLDTLPSSPTEGKDLEKTLPYAPLAGTPYGRSIRLTLQRPSTYAIDASKQTSSATVHKDDLLLITSTVWWKEGGKIQSQSLQKILSRWNTTL